MGRRGRADEYTPSNIIGRVLVGEGKGGRVEREGEKEGEEGVYSHCSFGRVESFSDLARRSSVGHKSFGLNGEFQGFAY